MQSYVASESSTGVKYMAHSCHALVPESLRTRGAHEGACALRLRDTRSTWRSLRFALTLSQKILNWTVLRWYARESLDMSANSHRTYAKWWRNV